jgi:SepF-like predicted cell division protein (DUF552 family)
VIEIYINIRQIVYKLKYGGSQMVDVFSRIKNKILGSNEVEEDDIPDEFGEDYLEIDTDVQPMKKKRVFVTPFTVREFQDVKAILEALRGGYTIALVNIRPLKDKDLIELKRVVNKLKKTAEAIDGDIAGFGEDWLVATPNFAQVGRDVPKSVVE